MIRAASTAIRACCIRFAVLVRQRWRLAAAILMLSYVLNMLIARSLPGFTSETYLRDALVEGVASALVGGVLVIGAMLFAEALQLRGAARVVITVLLAVAASAASAGVLWAARGGTISNSVERQQIYSDASFALRFVWYYTGLGLLLAAYFAVKEREAAATRAAQAAALEREDAQRALVESRLRVLQARVEPELLFGALDEVRRRYGRDPLTAELLLDDMIGYLRAVLPHMRGESSTLGREAALAEAYLRIVPAGREGRLEAATRIPADLAAIAFPPLVLLPLVHAASSAAASRILVESKWLHEDGAEGAVAGVDVRARCACLPQGWSNEGLDAIAHRVAGHLGGATSLRARFDGHDACVEVRWRMPDVAAGAVGPV